MAATVTVILAHLKNDRDGDGVGVGKAKYGRLAIRSLFETRDGPNHGRMLRTSTVERHAQTLGSDSSTNEGDVFQRGFNLFPRPPLFVELPKHYGTVRSLSESIPNRLRKQNHIKSVHSIFPSRSSSFRRRPMLLTSKMYLSVS